MKMKNLTICLTLAVLLGSVGTSWGADDLVFRSVEDKFRFLYPDTWIVKKGTGANVKAKVIADDGSSCNVVVRRLPKELIHVPNDRIMSNFSEHDMLEMIREKWNDAVLLEGGTTHIDNRLARYGYFDLTHRVHGVTVQFRQLSAMTTEFEKVYHLTCGTEFKLFSKHKAEFEKLVRFFTFEY